MDLLAFLQKNSVWLKDLFTIIFTGTATVLSILTYKRAKATVLQPKRAEVIKRQTEALITLLNLITKNNNSVDDALDYTRIFGYNVDLILRDYGLIEIDPENKEYQDINTNIAGWIQFLENDIHQFVYVKGDLKTYDDTLLYANENKRLFHYCSELKKGNVKVHRIFFTKQYLDFFESLRDFSHNPFIPNELQIIILKIGESIESNIFQDLRTILKTLVEEYHKALEDKELPQLILIPEYRHQELWRLYEKLRKHHDSDYLELKNKIRSHLSIDEKW